ncbi:MAG: hypothetical protein EBW39_04895, partial [Betaproteobacteria bacterium]|nr:hypothetical protein [Betaproteobacteria bacterium]
MVGLLRFLSIWIGVFPLWAQASSVIDQDEKALGLRAKEAATAGVRLQCSQAQAPSLTAHVSAVSRTYVLHR